MIDRIPTWEETTATDEPQAPKWEDTESVDHSYFSDVGRHAVDEIKAWPGTVVSMAKTAVPIARGMLPDALPQSAVEMAQGKSFKETPVGRSIEGAKDVIENSPNAAIRVAKDMGQTVAHPFDSFREKPVGTLSNASILFGGAASLAKMAAPEVATLAETASNAMGRRATGFTKALIKGKNFDKANDAVQWMIDKKILTPSADAEKMLERVGAVKEDAWDRMSQAMKEQNAGTKGEQIHFDTNKAVGDLEGLRPKTKNGTLLKGGQYDQMNAQIDDAIETIKAHGEGPIPWDEANDLKGNLNANFDTTKSNAVNNLKKRIHGTFNKSIETQMDEAATTRGGNIDGFKAAKKDYGSAKTAEKALDNLRSSKAGNRQIGLTDTMVGVGGAAAHGATGAGAVILAKKLIERFGLNTGATLAQKLSLISAKAPELLGPYAPAIQKALAVGGTELAFTHGILAKSDPNYRAFVKELAGRK